METLICIGKNDIDEISDIRGGVAEVFDLPDVTWFRLVVRYRRFGKPIGPIFKINSSWIQYSVFLLQ